MNFGSMLQFECSLTTEIIRADGSRERGVGSPARRIAVPMSLARRLWERAKLSIPFFAAMGFVAFTEWMYHRPADFLLLSRAFGVVEQMVVKHGIEYLPPAAIVTTAAMNYTATLFTNSSNPLINFKYHDIGTGKLQGSTNSITGATNATPIVITEASHGRNTNDLVTIASVTGNTAANGDWQILVINSNTYSLYGSVGNGAFGGSPTAQRINGIADTALTTPAGITRVAGSQSNPTSNSYQTVATLTNNTAGLLVVSEWGLFSASSSGTLWDRRWFNDGGGGNAAPQTTATARLTAATNSLNVNDGITITYTVTMVAGGS